MKPEQIRAIALEVAKEMPQGFIWFEGCSWEEGVLEDKLIDFAIRFLAAITERAEPVAWMRTS